MSSTLTFTRLKRPKPRTCVTVRSVLASWVCKILFTPRTFLSPRNRRSNSTMNSWRRSATTPTKPPATSQASAGPIRVSVDPSGSRDSSPRFARSSRKERGRKLRCPKKAKWIGRSSVKKSPNTACATAMSSRLLRRPPSRISWVPLHASSPLTKTFLSKATSRGISWF